MKQRWNKTITWFRGVPAWIAARRRKQKAQEQLRGMVGVTFWDPETKQFLYIHAIRDGLFHCGGFYDYYDSAWTSTTRQNLSSDYLAQCERVGAIDLCTHAKFNGIGWKAI